MRFIARIGLFLGIFFTLQIVLIVASMIAQAADLANRLHPGSGQAVAWGLGVLVLLTAVWPILQMLRMPGYRRPPKDRNDPAFGHHRDWVRQNLASHPSIPVRQEAQAGRLEAALELLEKEAEKKILATAGDVFVATALSQNGRLDGLIVLAAQLRLVWQLARLYRLRPAPRQILYLYGNVGASLVISGQLDDLDLQQLTVPLVTAATPSVINAVPGLGAFANILVQSLINGASNAFLTLRVGFLARAYCAPLVEPDRKLVRRSATIAAAALLHKLAAEQGKRLFRAIRDTCLGAMEKAAKNLIEAFVESLHHMSLNLRNRLAGRTGNALSG